MPLRSHRPPARSPWALGGAIVSLIPMELLNWERSLVAGFLNCGTWDRRGKVRRSYRKLTAAVEPLEGSALLARALFTCDLVTPGARALLFNLTRMSLRGLTQALSQ